jgi:hypothetical protein
MFLMCPLVTGHTLVTGAGIGVTLSLQLGWRRRHVGIVAVIQGLSARACRRRVRHRTGQFERSRDALHRQRHDQHPQQEESDERAHGN